MGDSNFKPFRLFPIDGEISDLQEVPEVKYYTQARLRFANTSEDTTKISFIK